MSSTLHPKQLLKHCIALFIVIGSNTFQVEVVSLITSVNSLLSCLENWSNYVLSEDERIIRACLGGKQSYLKAKQVVCKKLLNKTVLFAFIYLIFVNHWISVMVMIVSQMNIPLEYRVSIKKKCSLQTTN